MAYLKVTGEKAKQLQSAYQQNLEVPTQPAQQKQESTLRDTLGKIYRIQQIDPYKGSELQQRFNKRMSDPSSKYYNAYIKPTNHYIDELASYGIDTSKIDDDFFARNDYLQQYLNYEGTSKTPTAPKKKSSAEEKAAYAYYQILKNEDASKKVDQQWQALQDELTYWAKRTDRNYSDDELINNIDWSKYSALTALENDQRLGHPTILNRGTTYSRDALYGVIWNARNGKEGENLYNAMAHSALGDGVTWEYNQDIADKRNPKSEKFNPYALGSTVDDAAVYFGVPGFDGQWAVENDGLQWNGNETDKKMFKRAAGGIENAKNADAELEALNEWLDKRLANPNAKPEKILEKIDWKKYPTLAAMDKSLGKGDEPGTGELLAMAWAVDYKYSDLEKKVYDRCAENAAKIKDDQYAEDISKSATLGDVDAVTGGAPVFASTQQNKAVVDSQNATLADAAEMFYDNGTDAENAVVRNSWSAGGQTVKSTWTNIFANGIPAGSKLVEDVKSSCVKNLSSAVMKDADIVQNYNIFKNQIDGLEKTKSSLEAELGDLIHYGEKIQPEKTVTASVNGKSFDIRLAWDWESGSYQVSSSGDVNLPEDLTAAEYQTALKEQIDKANELRDTIIKTEDADVSEEMQDKVNQYRRTVADLDVANQYMAENEAAYTEASQNAEKARREYDAAIAMMKDSDVDTTTMEQAAQVSDFLLNFTQYDPTKWEQYNVYHEYSQMAASDPGKFEQMYGIAETADKEIMDQIEVADWIIGYCDDNGIQVPDAVKENVTRWRESLQRQHEDFEYLSKMKQEGFSEEAEKGKEIAARGIEFDWDAYDGTLESQPAWNLLSDEQKAELKQAAEIYDITYVADNLFNGMMDSMDIENRLFGTYRLGDLMTDYEKDTFYYLLSTEGMQGANEYLDHLTDGSYGVMNSRAAERTRKSADELADSGFWGRRAADALSMLMSPVAAVGSMYYMADYGLKKLRGERVELNPDNINLSANIYKKEARAEIQREIDRVYADNEVLRQVMSGLQEIISNRGDSFMNMIAFGPLFKGIDSNMLQEFMSAMPMAFTAATDAVADAKTDGASDTQLLGIFMSTLLAEAGTEAISLDNMKEAFKMGADAIDARTVSDFLKNWLTKSGVSEMIGESANDAIENWAAETFTPDSSEYKELYEHYRVEEGLSDEDAKLMARRDQMMGILHTALISYLSPGMDIMSFTGGKVWSGFNKYRSVTKDLQQAGFNVSILDVMRSDKAKKSGETIEATQQEKQTTEAPAAEAPAAEQEQTEAPSPEERARAAAEEEAKKDELFRLEAEVLDEIAAEYSAIESSKTGSKAAQTATLASVLDMKLGEAYTDLAQAVADNLDKVFQNPVDAVQGLLLGCYDAKIDSNAVKQAVASAVLGGQNSAAYQATQTEEFKSADLDKQAEILAQTVEADAANQEVQENITKGTRENRVSHAEMDIIISGELNPGIRSALTGAENAEKAAVKAEKTLARVQENLDAKQAELEASSQAVQSASETFRNDPSDANKKALTGALSKHSSNTAVVQEYRQALEKANQDLQFSRNQANDLRDRALTQIRQQAEQAVAQQDQERAEVQQKLQEQERVQMEQLAKEQAEEDERSGKAWEDNRDALIEDILNSEHLEGEERDTRRDELMERSEQIKMGNIDMNGLMNNTEGYLAINALSRKLGVDIKLSDTLPGNARGQYANGVVYLNSNMIKNGKMTVGQAMVETALHEITHSMESTNSYKPYRNIVLESMFGDIKNDTKAYAKLQAAIDQKKADYKKGVGQELSDADAEKEIVADFARTKLSGKDVVQRFMDAGLGGKMRNILHNINQAIKNFSLTGKERQTAEYLRKAERAFQRAMNEVAKNSVHPEGNQFSVAQFAQAAGLTFDAETRELRDQNGNVIDGVNNKVTTDMVDSMPVGMLINSGLAGEQNTKAKDMMAGLMNMVARYRDSNLVWEIGASTLSSTFSALKSNADPQYKTTVDFGTVCAKTQAIIDVMSQVMLDRVKAGQYGGLTREEIMTVYDKVNEAKLSVPCPVCYVFSRWMGVPSLLGQMSQYQHDYVVTDENGNIDKAATQEKVDKYVENAIAQYGNAKEINKAKSKLQSKLTKLEEKRIDLEKQLYDRTLSKEQKDVIRGKIKDSLAQMVELDNKIGEVSAYNWITQALCKEENGKLVVDDAFVLTPDEILFDLNRTGEFAEFEKNWHYRNTRGAGMGKGIMPYGGETIGDIIYGENKKRQSTITNPWLNMDSKAAQKQLDSAIKRARQQNLVGGQRLQSTSDFRPEWGLDYIMTFLELQAANSKVQMYTKVAEAVDFFASVGADVNLSIMGKGQGWHIDENGEYVLDFSSITGMDYKTAKALKDKYDNVQMILVGMNDTHIRLAMKDSDIDFIIPWHSSGNSKDTLAGLIASVGETLDDSQDYSATQTDHVSDTRTAEQKALWDARVKLLYEGGDALNQAEREILLSNKYTAALYDRFTKKGVDDDCYGVTLIKEQANQIFPYEYWDTSLTKDQADENGRRFTEYCESMGLVPRFSQFKDDPGYWKLLIDRPMYDNAGNYRSQKVVDVTNARIGNLNESGELVNSDLPTQAQAKYAPKDPRNPMYEEYTAREKQAIENAEAALEKKYDDGNEGQYSVYGNGNLTTADLEQIVSAYLSSAVKPTAYHSEQQLETIEDYLDAVDEDVLNTATMLKEDKNLWFDPLALEEVSEREAADINEKLGIDVTGYTHMIDRNFFNHVEKRHGENGLHDHTMADLNDVARVGWVIKHYDTVDEIKRGEDADGITTTGYKTSDNSPMPIVRYEKKIDGNLYVVEAVGENAKKQLHVVSAYMQKDNSVNNSPSNAASRVADVTSPSLNAQDEHGSPATEMIAQQENGVNGQLSAGGENTTADIDQQLLNAGIITEKDLKKTKRYDKGEGQRQWAMEGAQRSDELAEEAKQYVLNHPMYQKDTNAAELDRAISWIRGNKREGDADGYQESLRKVTSSTFNYHTKDGQARMIAMMGLAAAKNDVSAQVLLSDAYDRQGTDIAQALQARKLWNLMTPEGRISSLQKMLGNTQDDINRAGGNVELKFSEWIYRAAAAAENEEDFQKVRMAAANQLAEQIPANWKDKFRAWRMLSMLAAPRTHIRNVLGNAFFVPVVGIKNKLSAIGELTTKEKTKTLSPVLTSDARSFARQDARNIKDILTGEAKYNEGSLVKQQQKPFHGLLQAVIDLNSNWLEKEDWIFLRGHYRRAMGGWMMANGYTSEQLQNNPALLEQGRAYAVQEAQKATYRDANKLAQILNKVSNEGGISGFVVDAVLPFKKTPANILRRGIEYSPVGIMRSLTTDLYHLKQWNDAQKRGAEVIPEKAISPTQFIDRLCSGLSGSAILAVGALLSSMGVVSCGLTDDDDDLEKAKGNQKYAIKFSIGGQDFTYTMDWAAPMSMPFFVGAAIHEQLSEEGNLDVNSLVNAFGNITEPVLNLSMLDGVNTLFKTSQYDDTDNLTQIGAKVVSNYVTSYVPSLLGAITRTFADDTSRKSFVKSGEGTGVMGTFRYAVEQTENKLPGLSKTNIPMRDVWGNEQTASLAERIIENFISPGYINEYKNDPILNEMGRLYDITNDSGLIPSDPSKTITYKNQKYVLEAEEWDQYKATRGRTAFEMLTELLNNADYRKADATTQTNMIKDVWSYADKVGKAAVIPNYALEKSTVAEIGKEGTINGYKDELIKALNAGDIETYEAMAEALVEKGVEESEIKTKIGNAYRDKYKEAYRMGNYEVMAQIEDTLDWSGFDFDTEAWEDQVDEKYNK